MLIELSTAIGAFLMGSLYLAVYSLHLTPARSCGSARK